MSAEQPVDVKPRSAVLWCLGVEVMSQIVLFIVQC